MTNERLLIKLIFALSAFCLTCRGIAESKLTINGSLDQIELQVLPETNNPWRLEHSTNLKTWKFITEPRFGAQDEIVDADSFWRIKQFGSDASYPLFNSPLSVSVIDRYWYDSDRDYQMQVRIATPALSEGAGPYPVVLLSHGLFGSTELFDTLADYLCQQGYIAIMLGHADLRPSSRIERVSDIHFAISYLKTGDLELLLRDRIDFSRIGILGHSFGAYTALATVGARFYRENDSGAIFHEPQNDILCAVAMSPQGPGVAGLFSESWDLVTRPTLTMHGTLDTDPINGNDPSLRKIPYLSMSDGGRYHITLDGAEHNAFTDNGIDESGDRFSQWYFPAIIAFLDAYLKNDTFGSDWLNAYTINRLSSELAKIESK